MKQFKTLNSNETSTLTVFNYESCTKKSYPYYQNSLTKGINHFAICPICRNPIQIINLYNKNIITNGRVTTLYAKHYSKSVKNLIEYNHDKFINCPLRSKISFNSKNKNTNKGRYNEIVDVISNNKDLIKKTIQQLSGINLSQKIVDNIFDKFSNEEGYYFEAVNKFNIPFSVLYLSGSQNIFWQYINKDSIELIESFKSSILFELKNNQIVLKKDKSFSKINLFFLKFKASSTDNPKMTMVIQEKNNKVSNRIYEKIIDIDISSFWDRVIQ